MKATTMTVMHCAFVFLLMYVKAMCTVPENCSQILGGDNKEISFSCHTPGRTQLAVSWFHGDEELFIDNVKYRLSYSQDRLTISNIVAGDEGHYSCSYVAQSTTQRSDAGCLTVYGKIVYASCIPNESCTDHTTTSENGTIVFDLGLTHIEAGPTRHTQNYVRSIVKKGNRAIFSLFKHANTVQFIDHVNRWWTVEEGGLTDKTVILHQALASDRGMYTVVTESTNPGTGTSTDVVTKHIIVTALECGDPPTISSGVVATAGSVGIVGSQANYSCHDGCTLQGSDFLTCVLKNSTPTWSGHIPSCSCFSENEVEDVSKMFQLQIGPTGDCSTWTVEEQRRFINLVKQQVSEGMEELCDCNFTSSVSETRLKCSYYPSHVTIRGFITGIGNYTVDNMLRLLGQWVSSMSTVILTESSVLDVNKNCEIEVNSWNDNECLPPPRASSCICE